MIIMSSCRFGLMFRYILMTALYDLMYGLLRVCYDKPGFFLVLFYTCDDSLLLLQSLLH